MVSLIGKALASRLDFRRNDEDADPERDRRQRHRSAEGSHPQYQASVGLRWCEVTIAGFANHAGTTPMDKRQDAMLAAARFTVAVNDAVRSEPGRQVATVGRVVVSPNTTNVIPAQVMLTVDLRDLDSELALSNAQVLGWIDASAAALGLTRQRMPSG